MVVVKKRRRWWIPATILMTLILLTGVAWYVRQPALERYSNSEIGISLEFNADDLLLTQSDPNLESGVFARIQERENIEPALLVSLRLQSGLSRAAGNTRTSSLELVTDAIKRSYPNQFPDFQEVNERNIMLDGLQAFRYVFSYQSPAGEAIQQVTYTVELSDDEVLLVNMQTLQGEFEEVNERYFQPIIDSLELQ